MVDGCIQARYSENGAVVTLRARDLRRTNTGPHAHIAVKVNDKGIAFDVLNIHRNASRNDLARAALKRLGELERAALAKDLPLMLDEFCLGLWEFHLSQFEAEWMVGDLELPALPFSLKPYVREECGTILFSPPKAGKSYSLDLMLVSIDAGCDTLWPCQQTRVLKVNLERGRGSLLRRLPRVNRALGLEPKRPLLTLNARGKSLADVIQTIRRIVDREKVGIVGLDSISRGGFGKLTDDDTGNSVIDALNSLCETWVALGHTPRADPTHLFGSQMFDAGEDIGIQLTSQATAPRDGVITLGVGLLIKLANDMACPPLELLGLDFTEQDGLVGVRRPATREFPALVAGQGQKLEDEIYGLLLDMGRATATEIIEALALKDSQRANVSRLLNADPRLSKRRDGRKVFYEVRYDDDVCNPL